MRRVVFCESKTFVIEKKYSSQIAKWRRNSRNRKTMSTEWSRLSIEQSAIKRTFEFRRLFMIVNANCQNNYESLIKKIDTNSNTYRFARRVRNFTTFANFSIIFFTNRIMFDTENTKQLSIAMQHDEMSKHEILFWIISELRKFQQFSLSNLNFSEVRRIFHIFFF